MSDWKLIRVGPLSEGLVYKGLVFVRDGAEHVVYLRRAPRGWAVYLDGQLAEGDFVSEESARAAALQYVGKGAK